jgi:hypothetical protein
MRAILIATGITRTEVVTKSTSLRSRIAEQFQSELPLSVEMETTALANTTPGPVQDTVVWVSGSGKHDRLRRRCVGAWWMLKAIKICSPSRSSTDRISRSRRERPPSDIALA